jgi:ABC-2 type transport system permease protein
VAVTAGADGTVAAAGEAGGPPRQEDPARPVPLRHFARLRLRITANGFRGRPYRVGLFVLGLLVGLFLSADGFILFAVSAVVDRQAQLLIMALGGATLVVGSVLMPLLWFGIDDTLDPARFALLPISRGRLVCGLLVASALGVPALALLVATCGLLVPATLHGGPAGAAVQAVGVLLALALCLAAGRAVTTALATVLRSRRARDLAWVLLALLAALVGPLQLLAVSAAGRADWDRVAAVARVIGWTPLGAPYTVGLEMADGRPWAAATKLAITAAALAGLLWWWSRSLESALTGAALAAPTRSPDAGARATASLLPRALPWLRPTPAGAIVAREVRYLWRDAKRRSNMIMIFVISLFLPVALLGAGFGGGAETGAESGVSVGPSDAAHPLAVLITMLFIGAFVTSALANQFGYDGTSYGTHLLIGVPGRVELRARAAAYSVYLVPLLLVVGVVAPVVQGAPAMIPAVWGVVLAAYGAGVAVNVVASVVVPYPLPESSNPFALGSGGAVAKSALALLTVVLAGVVAAPVVVAAATLDPWSWLVLPVGAGYGLGAAALGVWLGGGVVDRRAPELLAAVTPGR